MPFLDDNHQRAAYLIVLLGAGLAIALFPFATGLLGIPVLYVVFGPLYRRVVPYLRPALAAGVVVTLGVVIVFLPLASAAGLIVAEAEGLASGVGRSAVLQRISELRVAGFDVGADLADLGRRLTTWVASSAFTLAGAATRLTLNLVIAFFGLFYMLQRSATLWEAMLPYIPFSTANAERLRTRFSNVTVSTVIGTGLTAVAQGSLVGAAFWATGLSNGLFWGVVTAICSILPVVGSGLIWGPGAVVLYLDGRVANAVGLAAWGAIVVSNTDNVIRPLVYRRWANIHPLITIIGAFGGVRYFGILGLLIGPLALSYFFELLRMYREEYMTAHNR
jgi:predicted PurR-regulated permease PerM